MSKNRSPQWVRFGGSIDRVQVSLRIFGDTLEPSEVTALLGHQPTRSRRKNDVSSGRVTRRERTARDGAWFLDSGLPEEREVEAHVQWILDRLSGDQGVWTQLAQRFTIDIFCGLFLDEINRGFTLSPPIMDALAKRHLHIGFDIYGHGHALKPLDTDIA